MATAKRKGWDNLTESYRARLIRGGMTKSQYESGASLAQYRGHAKTPEHPERASRHPEKYSEYLSKRQRTGGTVSAQELNDLQNQAYQHHYNTLGPGRY